MLYVEISAKTHMMENGLYWENIWVLPKKKKTKQ
jgi:hypothetical protein